MSTFYQFGNHPCQEMPMDREVMIRVPEGEASIRVWNTERSPIEVTVVNLGSVASECETLIVKATRKGWMN